MKGQWSFLGRFMKRPGPISLFHVFFDKTFKYIGEIHAEVDLFPDHMTRPNSLFMERDTTKELLLKDQDGIGPIVATASGQRDEAKSIKLNVILEKNIKKMIVYKD